MKSLPHYLLRCLGIFFCAALCYAMSQDFVGTQETSSVQTKYSYATWQKLEEGLFFAECQDKKNQTIYILRIDPHYYDFVLCAAGQKDGKAKTLGEWGKEEGLSAAINASMYLPDGKTSTGYMRYGSYINSKRLVRHFGGIFLAQPYTKDLPKACILDHSEADWEKRISQYGLAIQNYRILSPSKHILWPQTGAKFSISAIGQDESGKILFFHTKEKNSVFSFAKQVLDLDLHLCSLLYTEGGAQSGLFITTESFSKEFNGKNAIDSFFSQTSFSARIPNVLGIRKAY